MSVLFYLLQFSIRDGRPRRSLQWFLLAVVVFALTGFIALPKPFSPNSMIAERYPCEGCACGCPTAEFCWNECCCHSDQEKLRWAERNGVTPPDNLVARDSQSDANIACSAKPACCSKRVSADASDSSATEYAGDNDSVKSPRATVGVLMWKAAECRGIQNLWTLLATIYVAPSDAICRIDPPLLGWIPSFDEHAVSHLSHPDPPVP